MEFRLLGPVAVRRDGVAVEVGPAKQRALLAALMLEPNRIVAVDHLIGALWDGDPPASAVSNVRTYASRLRALLTEGGAGRLVGHAPGYRLRVEDAELDVTAFHRLVADGRAALAAQRPDDAARLLGDALALWWGTAAEDVPRTAYLRGRLAALEAKRLAALEDWLEARQRLCDDAGLVADLRRLTGSHPLHERLWARLMLSLYRIGDVGAALTAFQEARTVLAEDLGVDPGPELIGLHRAILARDPALSTPGGIAAGGIAAGGTRPTTETATGWPAVPRELPPGVALSGRDDELAAIVTAARAGSPRGGPSVISVHGPRGVGTSALAIRAATDLIGHFPDGQLYVNLRASGPDDGRPPVAAILGRFLRALGVPCDRIPDGADEAAALFRSVTAQRRLLVLIDHAGDEAQVRPLLTAARAGAVILTGQRRLAALDVDAHVEVKPLGPHDAAVLLSEASGVALIESTVACLWRLAAVCEGRPLALRIAAARLTAARAGTGGDAGAAGRILALVTDAVTGERERTGGLAYGDLAVDLR